MSKLLTAYPTSQSRETKQRRIAIKIILIIFYPVFHPQGTQLHLPLPSLFVQALLRTLLGLTCFMLFYCFMLKECILGF